MGSAAVLQLVAYGAQDLYLTSQPQISYFKSVHKRHTQFAMEEVEIPIIGNIFPGSKVSVTIPKNADLLKGLNITYKPNKIIPISQNIQSIVSDLGHVLFDNLEIEIGGQLIDRHYSIWLSIWRDLTEPNPYGVQFLWASPYADELPVFNRYLEYTKALEAAQGNLGPTGVRQGEITVRQFQSPVTQYNTMAFTHLGYDRFERGITNSSMGTLNAPTEACVPMRFWFCRHPGLALPLIALQYHEVKFNMTFAKKSELIIPLNGYDVEKIPIDLTSVKIWADYVYLDSPERKQFAQNAHEYLIEQVQYQSVESENVTSVDLIFNHPVKELIITGKPRILRNTISYNSYPEVPLLADHIDVWGKATPYPIIVNDDVTLAANSTNLTLQLVFNQNDRFSPRNLKYFTKAELYNHHTGNGSCITYDNIAVYSFALRPEELQPSGTCNFSRIDRAKLLVGNRKSTETLNTLNIYAINYNVFRVMSGMGGLAYSN